jgi:hypothetical protein
VARIGDQGGARAGSGAEDPSGIELPQYSMLWRVIEAEAVPTSEELGIGQVVWSPIAQGVLTGKYLPGQPPPEVTGHGRQVRRGASSPPHGRRRAHWAVQKLTPSPTRPGSHGPLAVAWCCRTPNVSYRDRRRDRRRSRVTTSGLRSSSPTCSGHRRGAGPDHRARLRLQTRSPSTAPETPTPPPTPTFAPIMTLGS